MYRVWWSSDSAYIHSRESASFGNLVSEGIEFGGRQILPFDPEWKHERDKKLEP